MSVIFKHRRKGFEITVEGKRGKVDYTKKGFVRLKGCNYNGGDVINGYVLKRDFEKVV